jgi:predicted nucleic acid-binding Zn ribbon protein
MRCIVCGALLKEGEDLICKICEEQIRAEALEKKETLRREALKITKGEEHQKKKTIKDFKSLAEYLEYLKKNP